MSPPRHPDLTTEAAQIHEARSESTNLDLLLAQVVQTVAQNAKDRPDGKFIPQEMLKPETLFPYLYDPQTSRLYTRFESNPYNSDHPLAPYERYLPCISSDHPEIYRLINDEIRERIITANLSEDKAILSSYAYLACLVNARFILNETYKLSSLAYEIGLPFEELFDQAIELSHTNLMRYKPHRNHAISTHIGRYLVKQLATTMRQRYFPELRGIKGYVNTIYSVKGEMRAEMHHKEDLEEREMRLADIKYYEQLALFHALQVNTEAIMDFADRHGEDLFSEDVLLPLFTQAKTMAELEYRLRTDPSLPSGQSIHELIAKMWQDFRAEFTSIDLTTTRGYRTKHLQDTRTISWLGEDGDREAIEVALEQQIGTGDTTSERAIANIQREETLEWLQEHFRNLSPDQRHALWIYYGFDGKGGTGVRDCARQMQITIPAFKQTLAGAHIALKTSLQGLHVAA